jgi:hypothetical protein
MCFVDLGSSVFVLPLIYLVAFGHFKIEVSFFPFFPCLHLKQLDMEFHKWP